MKSAVLLFFLMLSTTLAFSQISDSHQKKILKLLGEGFKELTPSEKYNFYPQTSGLAVDTSTTVLGDTVGLVFNGEYVIFHDLISSRNSKEIKKYLAPKPVTIREYLDFKNHVRDSIARTKLYYSIEEDLLASEFINHQEEYIDLSGNKLKYVSADRAVHFGIFSLNWEKQFRYEDVEYVPALADMYLPATQQFRKKRIFDERKFNFNYTELIDSLVPNRSEYVTAYHFSVACGQLGITRNTIIIENDNDWWAKSAKHNFDESAVLSELYTKMDGDNPVIGLLGTQAKAYCFWKQDQLQKEMDRAKLPFEVAVTLPEMNDLSSLSSPNGLRIPHKDYTESWKISQKDYSEFIDYVIDSISRTALYFNLQEHNEALKFLKYRNVYFQESALEYVQLDFTTRETNRQEFSLNFKTKIRKNRPEVKEILKEVQARNSSCFRFSYSTFRSTERAKKYDVPLKYSPEGRAEKGNNVFRLYEGVRAFLDLGELIENHDVCVFPGETINLDEKSEELIPWLSYQQALAFYNWKYQIDKFDPKKDDWQQFVFPSEEQFEFIQKGDSIVIPEHTLDFPTPLFRYVVHIYPK